MNNPPQGPSGFQPPQQSVHPGYQQQQHQGYGQQQPPPPKKSGCATVALVIGGIALLGVVVLVPLAIYGVNRYLSSAKTAEAKATVRTIHHSAVSAHESRVLLRKTGADALCGSANPVPNKVPSGRKYQAAPSDYAGDPANGWRCLNFELTMPQYYQYQYNAGSGYVATANPSVPSSEGFEAVARGDLDGDGKFSMFAMTATLQANNELQSQTRIYIEDELE